MLDRDTPKAQWVVFQLIASVGAGFPLSTLLPAVMAALPESRVAAATAAYAFIKTFGYIWGVVVPSIVFNANLPLILSEELGLELRDGAAYGYAGEMYRLELSEQLRDQVTEVYTRSLRNIWWARVGVSLAGFLLTWIQRDLELRTELDTDYGLEAPVAEKAGGHHPDQSAEATSTST